MARFLVTVVRQGINIGKCSAKLKLETAKEEKKTKKPQWQRQSYFRISLRGVPMGGGKRANFSQGRAQSLVRKVRVAVKVGLQKWGSGISGADSGTLKLLVTGQGACSDGEQSQESWLQ